MKRGSPSVAIHCEPRYIDLNEEKEAIMDRRIMREGIERLVSLELAGRIVEYLNFEKKNNFAELLRGKP